MPRKSRAKPGAKRGGSKPHGPEPLTEQVGIKLTAAQHAAKKPLGLESLQAFLRDESGECLAVCRRPNPALPPEARVESVAGIIMHPHTRRFWIAPDVPSKVDFQLV